MDDEKAVGTGDPVVGEIPLDQAQKLLELQHTTAVVMGIIQGAMKTLAGLQIEEKALWAKITKERGLREEDEYGFTLPADIQVSLEVRGAADAKK